MKKANSLIVFLAILVLPGFGQDLDLGKLHQKPYGVYLETPLFLSSYVNDYNVYTVNLEYLLERKSKTSFSVGYGIMLSSNYWSYQSMVLTTGVNKLIGRKNHFFEVGVGFFEDFIIHMLTFRLGYRAIFWKRLMVRAAYTPGLPVFYGEQLTGPVDRMLSVGIGYRFGIHIDREK
ncbi:MAG: hypothetical protein GXO89_00800 [Chlorobi bacterium]|nr:hypothetical protein [Chlorobiota bacterium]